VVAAGGSIVVVLLLCMEDKAATWFNGLEDEVLEIVADSIDEWKT
jgi:hypothetical protein